MSNQSIEITSSGALHGSVTLSGAKNAVLVTMASLVLTSGKSCLKNVPASEDVYHFVALLRSLGAHVFFDEIKNYLEIDTTTLHSYTVDEHLVNKMRASILIMGPLLARFGQAEVALPGGCRLGPRPIDLHLKGLKKMGAQIETHGNFLSVKAPSLKSASCILEYPSVGATENILMAACLTEGFTRIVNAALEPEVFDLITVLKKMGAQITIEIPGTIIVEGVSQLTPVEHEVMPDRLEAGSLLLAAALTKGSITLAHAQAHFLDVFLQKLEDMGHKIIKGDNGVGVTLIATDSPQAVSFRTGPYPGFPTDLQAQMMAAQCLAEGTSVIWETVFENRFAHVRELQKMGAEISVEGNIATIKGVEELYGTHVIASDIRAACALVLVGLRAEGKTVVSGIHHLRRGYQSFEKKLKHLGALININNGEVIQQEDLLRVNCTSNQIS